ncbi:GroES-like protein [Mycena chlorophos]|uniref:GroES-like protein n=1 Tax=Mycena chlorophos TaxID=658473 RepID=A0A8H6TN99_MYCCL|nr:GroES-like protein [Mycena chlorophos]
MTPTTQKSLVIPAAKAPLEIRETPIPAPGAGQVLVKIMAAGLNPMDPARHKQDMMLPAYPIVLGSDVAGVIEQVGDGVVDFKTGDEVFAQTQFGGYQQYVALPAATLIRKPKNISFDDVATFPITFSTACVALCGQAPIGLGLNPTLASDKPHAGKSAVVLGAGTSVGQFAIQLLKFCGFSTIIAYASAKHTEYLISLGATLVIDRNCTPLPELSSHPALKEHPVDVVYDTVMGIVPGGADAISPVDAGHDLLKPHGQLVTVNPRAALSANRSESSKGITLTRSMGFYVGPDVVPGPMRTLEHTKFGRYIIERLPVLLEQGVLVANRVEVLPGGLEGVKAGFERWYKDGGVSAVKLVAHPQESA